MNISTAGKKLWLLKAIIFASGLSSISANSSLTGSYHSSLEEPLQEHVDQVHAMTPNPLPYTITYDDGTETPPIQLKMLGDVDESLSPPISWEETLIGKNTFTVKPSNGKYVYVDVDTRTGRLKDTSLVVGVDDPGQARVHSNAALRSVTIQNRRSLRKVDKHSSTPLSLDSHDTHRKQDILTGTLKNLVIPFKFSDHVSRTLPSQSDLDILMNSEGPDPLCPTGSVRDVYLQNSFNQLDLQSTVIDWVTIDFTEAQCAGGESGFVTSFFDCLRNALDKAVAAGVNFGDYDMDNDGLIDGIAFFHSGYGAEVGGIDAYGNGRDDRIWSHKWAIYTSNWNNNGVRVYEYHISPAVWSTSGSNIGRIGVVAHETGHFLGLPDLYDYGSGSGIGSYGLMANSWGFDSTQRYPPLMSAWAKNKLGWITPTEVNSGGTYSLRQSCENEDMIIIRRNFPSSEYLLIENRQPCGFDGAMTQGGLAIFHLDDNANNNLGHPFQSGWPGNGNHYKVALLQADGGYDLERGSDRGDTGDLFHADGVNSIGPDGTSSGSSYPNTRAYQSGIIIDTELIISNISASGDTMTFDVQWSGDQIASPSATPTAAPTKSPTASPTKAPTKATTASPTKSLTASPTAAPTEAPTASPTEAPTALTKAPTASPTEATTALPSKAPTKATTASPTKSLTASPTVAPTEAPTASPTEAPTALTKAPTASPTEAPTASPTEEPTEAPTASPNKSPTALTKAPTASPTKSPTTSPMKAPTETPTATPTEAPFKAPTATCVDSPQTFWIELANNRRRKRNCSWIEQTNSCALSGASEMCPSTCGTCSLCIDSPLQFKVRIGSRNRWKFCRWAAGNKNTRCAFSGVKESCRDTCGTC